MSQDSFQRRVRLLIEAAGGKKPLARRLGVTDSAINSWLTGARPLESKLREACANSGISLGWLRDGHGDAAGELAKVDERVVYRRETQTARLSELPDFGHNGDGIHGAWRSIVRVLAHRLNTTQIAESMNEILANTAIPEDVRNEASQILVAAQLPKLKR